MVPAPATAEGRTRRREFDRPRFLYVVAAFVVLLMLGPVLVVAVFSFNDSRSLVEIHGFSTQWYSRAASDPDVRASIQASIEIALACTAICAVAGTMLAIGLVRGARRAAAVSSATVVSRLLAPETATAVASLLLFTQLGLTLGHTTVIAAHLGLCLPLVAVIVRARLVSINPELEPAAMDLGTTQLGAVRLVVLPLVWPAIVASALITFVISFDNFITSNFTAGTAVPPLPLRIYSMLRFGVTPLVNAIGVAMLILAVLLVASAALMLRWARRRARA